MKEVFDLNVWKSAFQTWRYKICSHFKCRICGKIGIHPTRRMNTAYVNDEQNYVTCCDACYLELLELYQEMWDTYHAGCL